jgi:methylglutaconyl-CoA hydratase
MSGERFGAERALHIGLVHEVVEDETALEERVAAQLSELRTAGPGAARAAKALLRDLRGWTTDDARAETVSRIAALRTSHEGQEGLSAFVEKRRPSWASEGE